MRDDNQEVVEIQGFFDRRLANFSGSALSPSPVASVRKGVSSQDYIYGNKAELEFGEGRRRLRGGRRESLRRRRGMWDV
jgi:hypothetical protein